MSVEPNFFLPVALFPFANYENMRQFRTLRVTFYTFLLWWCTTMMVNVAAIMVAFEIIEFSLVGR